MNSTARALRDHLARLIRLLWAASAPPTITSLPEPNRQRCLQLAPSPEVDLKACQHVVEKLLPTTGALTKDSG